jgi:hypothetical protein
MANSIDDVNPAASAWNKPILLVHEVTGWRPSGVGSWETEVLFAPGCDTIVRDDGGPTGIYVDMGLDDDDDSAAATLFLPEAAARQLVDDLLAAADRLAKQQEAV